MPIFVANIKFKIPLANSYEANRRSYKFKDTLKDMFLISNNKLQIESVINRNVVYWICDELNEVLRWKATWDTHTQFTRFAHYISFSLENNSHSFRASDRKFDESSRSRRGGKRTIHEDASSAHRALLAAWLTTTVSLPLEANSLEITAPRTKQRRPASSPRNGRRRSSTGGSAPRRKPLGPESSLKRSQKGLKSYRRIWQDREASSEG